MQIIDEDELESDNDVTEVRTKSKTSKKTKSRSKVMTDGNTKQSSTDAAAAAPEKQSAAGTAEQTSASTAKNGAIPKTSINGTPKSNSSKSVKPAMVAQPAVQQQALQYLLETTDVVGDSFRCFMESSLPQNPDSNALADYVEICLGNSMVQFQQV